MPYFTATVEILVHAENFGEAADAIAEALRNLCHDEASLWIDWHYRANEWNDDYATPKQITSDEAQLRFEHYK